RRGHQRSPLRERGRYDQGQHRARHLRRARRRVLIPKRKNRRHMPAVFSYLKLADDEREERHEARALDRLAERALPASREAGTAAREDLAVRVEELAQGLDVFVVEALDLRAEHLGFSLLCHKKLDWMG